MLQPLHGEVIPFGMRESLRLEKSTEIVTSNGQAMPPCPLTTSLSATSPWFLNTSRDGDCTTSLGSLCQYALLVLNPIHLLFWADCSVTPRLFYTPCNRDRNLNFLCLAHIFTLQFPRMGSGYYFEFAESSALKGPRLQMLHLCKQ